MFLHIVFIYLFYKCDVPVRACRFVVTILCNPHIFVYHLIDILG